MKLKRNGFTIVEILIVIVVIGILFGISANIYANIQNDTEATGAARHIDGIRESLIAASIKEERGEWWSEDELEACDTGTVTEQPYLDEVIAGCNNFAGLVDDNGNIKFRSTTVRLRYDNDSDNNVLGAITECGNSDAGINLTSDTSTTVPFTDDYLQRIDDILDGGDGNDCGSFRWDTASKHIHYKMSISENFLQ